MENPSTEKQSSFVPPRHWVGVEELDASYWSDPKIKEKRGQEFFEKPVEWVDKIESSGNLGTTRREFLTVMGASMAMTTFACARRPVHKIIPYVVKPEEIIPGVPNWYASTSRDCGHGCGILTKNREGRPIKLEGNPDHPMNKGRLCVRAQASVLSLYDPDRLKAPIARSRADGSTKKLEWSVADNEIQARLKQAGKVRVLTGQVDSEATARLVREFLSAFPGGQHVEYEPLGLEEVSQAQQESYGTSLVPDYRFDEADIILSLGADFLGNWLSPVEHAGEWVRNRKLASKNASEARLSKFVVVESAMTITGANADERLAVRPGDELKVALALAHEIIVKGKHSSLSGDSAVQSALAGYTAENVAQEIGIDAGKLRDLAKVLWDARGKGLVVGGGIHSRTGDALGLQIAVNLLNSALENEGATVDGGWSTQAPRAGFSGMSKLLAEMKSGQVDVLIIYRSNPAFTLPKSASFEDALKNVKFVVAVPDREDETALLADYVLPDHHYLENWGDLTPRKGLHSLQQPAMAPMHATRAFEDSLLTWIRGASLRTNGFGPRVADWHDYLMTHWKETHYRANGGGQSFETFWEGVLRTGILDNRGARPARVAARAFRANSLSRIPKYSARPDSEVVLSLYESVAMQDGRHANNAWLQEMPDPISSATWDNYLAVSPALAKKLDLHPDDVVQVSSGDASADLPVYVQPGLHPAAVSVAVGYGRRAVGKVGNLAGVDVFPFVQVLKDQLVFAGQSVKLSKTGRFYRLATTQWHTVTENRPVINDITFAEFKKNPAEANETKPELRLEKVPSMWPIHEYKGYRWGMAIDLNSCIGCAACTVACQAENNIPVVGRDQVRVSRQMHWIRIDRYYSGSPENPGVVFQPMLCQQCENASCETVCPVLATVHDDEGLNVQVYNRCVGTRYCQNNCPYKVRRFNFFDHWKAYQGEMNLVWNPDVTVRTRGIMEKCTFCVQRIREGKDRAKDNAERVPDGEIKTACQQTCPTDAIVFGDINDPTSRVSKLRATERAFRVLENLNNKPSISYLTKVRNVERSGSEEHASKEGAHHV